jgi:hypothetical protein
MPKNFKFSSCPKHLLSKNTEKCNESIRENKLDQAISFLTELKKGFGDDESVQEKIAQFMFRIILKDKTKRNLNLLNYIFNKAEKNLFNTELCIPVLGILLLLNTKTEDKVINEIFKRMINLDKKGLNKMIKKLPKSCQEKVKKVVNNGSN